MKQLGETAHMDDMQEIVRRILPFGVPGAEAPPAAKPAAPPAQPAPQEPASPRPELDFTLQRYASLCVELEKDPARASETLTRYGLRVEQKVELDAIWAAKFRAEPASYATFQKAMTVYAEWLRGQRGGAG
jgi:hypothetical protein